MADNDTTTMHSTVSAVQNSDYDVLIRGVSVNTDSKVCVKSIDPPKVKEFLKWLSNNCPERGEKSDCGISCEYEEFTPLSKMVTRQKSRKEFRDIWHSEMFQLATWMDIKDFLQSLLAAYDAVRNAKIAKRITDGDKKNPLNLELFDEAGKWRYRQCPCLTRFYPLEKTPSPCDDNFLYNALRKDAEGTIYWKEGDCTELPDNATVQECVKFFKNPQVVWRPVCDKRGISTPDFARLFLRDKGDVLSYYLKRIPFIAMSAREVREKSDGLPKFDLEETLRNEVPSLLLSKLSLVRINRVEYDETGKEIEKFDRYSVAVAKKEGQPLMERDALKDVVLTPLFQSTYFNPNFVKTFRQVSNRPDEGFVYIDLLGADKTGAHGKELAEKGENAPELPPNWRQFFFGADGDKPIFITDPRMCLLRFAYFMVNLLDAELPQIRQVLLIAGAGLDGKSTLLQMIQAVIGASAWGTLDGKPSDWKDSNTYGIINKVLITIPETQDAGEVLSTDLIKKATGDGSVRLRKLFEMAADYTPEKIMFAILTNDPVSFKETWMTTRVLPMVFYPNYTLKTQKTAVELVRSAYRERKEIVQWCFDFVAYYMNRRNVNGEFPHLTTPAGLLLLRDEDYDQWYEGKFAVKSIAEAEDVRREALWHCGEHPDRRFFYVQGKGEEKQDMDEIYDELFNCLLVEDENAVLSRKEFREAVIKAITTRSSGKSENGCDAHTLITILDIPLSKITYSRQYKFLMNALSDKYPPYKYQGDRGWKGVRLRTIYDTLKDEPAGNDSLEEEV